jgi:hypothetical protein
MDAQTADLGLKTTALEEEARHQQRISYLMVLQGFYVRAEAWMKTESFSYLHLH